MTSMVLFGAVTLWLLVFGLSPALLVTVTPRSAHTTSVWGLGGPGVLIAMLALPVVAAGVIGAQLARAGDNPIATTAVMVVVLGGPAAAVSWRAWRTQRDRVRAHLRSSEVGLSVRWRFAAEVRRPTPVPAAPDIERSQFSADRLLRRARAVGLLIALVAARVGMVTQGGPDTSPHFHFGPFMTGLVVACGSTVVLRVRRRRATAGAESVQALVSAYGWHITTEVDDSLAQRHPQLPLLRSVGHDLARTKTVVWGSCGERPFWVADQTGPDMDRAGRAWSKHRSTVIVELPGLALPRILITGFDTQRVGKWWSSMVRIELEAWNRTMGVWCAAGSERTTHAVLHPRAVEHLMATIPDSAQLLITGSTFALWRDQRLSTADIPIGLRCLMGLADLLPTFVVSDNNRQVSRRS